MGGLQTSAFDWDRSMRGAYRAALRLIQTGLKRSAEVLTLRRSGPVTPYSILAIVSRASRARA